MMHPYAEGNIASARREVSRALEELETAGRSSNPRSWFHVGLATTHLRVAQAQLDNAFELDEMAVTAGDEAT